MPELDGCLAPARESHPCVVVAHHNLRAALESAVTSQHVHDGEEAPLLVEQRHGAAGDIGDTGGIHVQAAQQRPPALEDSRVRGMGLDRRGWLRCTGLARGGDPLVDEPALDLRA